MYCMSLLIAHSMQCLKNHWNHCILPALGGTGVGLSLTHITTSFHLGIRSPRCFVTSEMLALQGS